MRAIGRAAISFFIDGVENVVIKRREKAYLIIAKKSYEHNRITRDVFHRHTETNMSRRKKQALQPV